MIHWIFSAYIIANIKCFEQLSHIVNFFFPMQISGANNYLSFFHVGFFFFFSWIYHWFKPSLLNCLTSNSFSNWSDSLVSLFYLCDEWSSKPLNCALYICCTAPIPESLFIITLGIHLPCVLDPSFLCLSLGHLLSFLCSICYSSFLRKNEHEGKHLKSCTFAHVFNLPSHFNGGFGRD